MVLGGIDFYPKKKVRLLKDVTRRFYGNWQEEKYRHYLICSALTRRSGWISCLPA